MAHTADDVIFADYPMFHIAGFFGRGIMAIADGMEIVIPAPGGARDKRFIENYWRFVEKFRISLLSGVPTTLAQLTKQPPAAQTLSSLRPYGVTGSTAFPAEIARQLEAMIGVRDARGYGADRIHRRTSRSRRATATRATARPGCACPTRRSRSSTIDDDGRIRAMRRRRDRPRGGEGPERHAGLSSIRAARPGRLLPDGWFNSGDLGAHRRRRLSLAHRPRQGPHHPRRPQHRSDRDRGDAAAIRRWRSRPRSACPTPMRANCRSPMCSSCRTPRRRRRRCRPSPAHSPERAAAPKQIVLIDKMPLTDVGKPAKVQLRLDAAKRAFTAALADVAGQGGVSVDMVADAKQGHRAVIKVALPVAPAGTRSKTASARR